MDHTSSEQQQQESLDAVVPVASTSSNYPSQTSSGIASPPRSQRFSHSPSNVSAGDGTSPTSTPKLTRRKSSFAPSEPDSSSEETDDSKRRKRRTPRRRHSHKHGKSSTMRSEPNEPELGEEGQEEEDQGLSESDREFTLKDRQDVINSTHPFGLPLWKPALYKKSRSIIRNANLALHSTPSSELYLYPGNVLWAITFGWWLALVSYIVSIFLWLTPCGGKQYARVLRELSYYIFWPFGKYVEREDGYYYRDSVSSSNLGQYEENVGLSQSNQQPLEADEAGGHEEEDTLLGRRTESGDIRRFDRSNKERGCFARSSSFLSKHGIAGLVFYFWFWIVIAPLYIVVSALCWFMVAFIPMAKLTYVLTRRLRKYPLSLHFKSGTSLSRSQRSVVLLCTYKAIGLQYYKYTYDGINIIFINMMPIALFTVFDYLVKEIFHSPGYLADPVKIFLFSLASVIPLSYFIGMAVASISAQSSAGMGAFINASFGSIIEILLYAFSLLEGYGQIVEGSIIGSLMAGVLLMPGVSMVSGGIKRKEQKFNAKSAGVTSTMLIMAIIGALTPTLFYQIYGQFNTICESCERPNSTESCQRCRYEQPNPLLDSYYAKHVKPLMYFCAVILVLSYLIGLWFTLRTHAALVWQTHTEQNEPNINRRNSSIYKRIIPLHMFQQLIPHSASFSHPSNINFTTTPTTQPTGNVGNSIGGGNARPQSAPGPITHLEQQQQQTISQVAAALADHSQFKHIPESEEEEPGGHDSPNWSKLKSTVVLIGCTALYAIIAEILVNSVKFILESTHIDEKFLGLTLFALVPNVVEFMNAVAFSLQGNIALSMEIGSAYALQVCLLQIPAMVAFSGFYHIGKEQSPDNTFTLVFPRWDVFCVVFSVFLLTYTYIEGKSNYFKGSILILSYMVLMAGFYWAPIPGSVS